MVIAMENVPHGDCGAHSDTEQRLRDAFGARAAEVHAEPMAYPRVSGGWKRRERRRRTLLAILIAVVFAVADGVGLWALNQADTGSHIIFSDPSAPQDRDIGRLGQP